MNTNESSQAVSPVVGVILVVALTVALSGVIGVFVFDLGQQVSDGDPASQDGVRFTEHADGTVTVTLVTGSKDSNVTIHHEGGETTLNSPGDSTTVSGEITVTKGTGDNTKVIQTHSPSTDPSAAGELISWSSRSDWDAATTDAYLIHDSALPGSEDDVIELGTTESSGTSLETIRNQQTHAYLFDTGSGTTAVDSMGVSDGTIYGGDIWSTGPVGPGAANFDGTDDYVGGITTADNAHSISFWVKPSREFSGDDEPNSVVVSGDTGGGHMGIALGHITYDAGGETFGMWHNGTTLINPTISADWHHFALVWDGSIYQLYIDGTSYSEFSGNNPHSNLLPSGINTELGARTSQSEYSDLGLDDYRVHSRTLTTAEIQALAKGDTYTSTGGTLITTTKSFSTATKPNLANLAYTQNDGTITVTVTGSPDTANAESQTVTLDGAPAYDITWADAHTDFDIELTLTTPNPSKTPEVDAISLEGQ